MNFLELDNRFPSQVGTLLTTRYFTLRSAQFCLSILIDSGILNFCAVRERSERSNAPIYPNCQIRDGRRRQPRPSTIQYPPKVSVSSLVNSLKGVSSRMLRQQRPDLRKRYWKGALRSPSYFAASCGGAPIRILNEYIDQQKTPS